MREAGLIQKWDTVLWMNNLLRDGKDADGEANYFELVQHAFGNPKTDVPFHEATQVSIDLIRPIFPICGAIILIGAIVMIIEKRNSLDYWAHFNTSLMRVLTHPSDTIKLQILIYQSPLRIRG